MMSFICELLAKALATFLAGSGVAFVGLWIYRKQKEYELVKQRYLEDGLDIAASNIEEGFNALSHNWSRCLYLVKMYRDIPDEFQLEELDKGFLPVETTSFNAIAFYRIHRLVNSDDLWLVYQVALAFLSTTNQKYTIEIPAAIRSKLSNGMVTEPAQTIVQVCLDELKDLNEKSYRFAEIVRALESIAGELERSKLDFKSIGSFHNRQVVQDALINLRQTFADKFEPEG